MSNVKNSKNRRRRYQRRVELSSDVRVRGRSGTMTETMRHDTTFQPNVDTLAVYTAERYTTALVTSALYAAALFFVDLYGDKLETADDDEIAAPACMCLN
jgi:hypothetical protein